jgi:diacylglycerol kinase family enzyme
MGYANRFALESPEPVRIHSMGGSGTLYETVNGTIGLPNVQIAAYPFGSSNFFVRYFGADNEHLFNSIMNQMYSDVTPIDAIHYENGYGIGFSMIGLEAVADRDGTDMLEKSNLPASLCYIYTAVKAALRCDEICQHYKIEIDGRDFSGEYLSILIAGGPCYGVDMYPAPEAHPNDGIIDIYLMKKRSATRLLAMMGAYLNGGHENMRDTILHERGRRIKVSADREITMSMDGELLFEREVSFAVIPNAVEFVCPQGIDIKQLPRIYNRPEEGCIGD